MQLVLNKVFKYLLWHPFDHDKRHQRGDLLSFQTMKDKELDRLQIHKNHRCCDFVLGAIVTIMAAYTMAWRNNLSFYLPDSMYW